MNKITNNYRKACTDLVNEFVKQYYTYDDGSTTDYYFIGEDRGLCPVAFEDDTYFNLSDIECALKYEMPRDIVMGWYEDQLNEHYKEEPRLLNLYTYWRMKTLSPELLEEEKQQELKESEQRVFRAKKDLEDAIS